jgi:hypothetical protein
MCQRYALILNERVAVMYFWQCCHDVTGPIVMCSPTVLWLVRTRYRSALFTFGIATTSRDLTKTVAGLITGREQSFALYLDYIGSLSSSWRYYHPHPIHTVNAYPDRTSVWLC